MDNRNNTPVPAAVITDALKKIGEVRTALTPYLIALTPKERQELAKMGDGNLAFVLKADELAQANPQLLPGYLDSADLHLDATTVAQLVPIIQALEGLAYDAVSTRMVAGSEGFVEALLVYGAFQAAARAGQPAAQAAVAELQPNFKRRRKAAKPKE